MREIPQYRPGGYLRDMLDSKGLLSNPQFYLEGFLASSPWFLNDIEFDNDDAKLRLLAHTHSKNPMTLFMIDLDKFNYAPIVQRDAAKFIDMVNNQSKWFQGKKRLVNGNVAKVFETIVCRIDLSVKEIGLLIGHDNKQVADEIKKTIRERGTKTTKVNLMEYTLQKN